MIDLQDALRHLVAVAVDSHPQVIMITLCLLAYEATCSLSSGKAGAIFVWVMVVSIAYVFVSDRIACTGARAAFATAAFLTFIVIFFRGKRALEGPLTRWIWNLPSAVVLGLAWWLFQHCYRATF